MSADYSVIHPSAFVPGRLYYSQEMGHLYCLGKFIEARVTDRPYYPDVLLTFETPIMTRYTFQWDMNQVFYELIEPDSDPMNLEP